jgi:hypothetical protein
LTSHTLTEYHWPPVVVHSCGREEGGLARELEALETGRRLGMHDSDWASLVGLAHRYGWRPSEGSEHYLLREGRRVVYPSEARALAGALDLPIAAGHLLPRGTL